MNELMIFENAEFGQIRTVEKQTQEYMGYFYLLEYGSLLKVGSTKNPYQTVRQLERQATKYSNLKIGRFVLSKPHTNYRQNKNVLQKMFCNEKKTGTEFFEISLDKALQLLGDNSVIYEDNSSEMEKRSIAFTNGMKSFLTGGANGLFKSMGE